MRSPVYRHGMRLPTEFGPAPGLPGLHYLQAVHGEGWIASSYFVERAAGNILVSPLVYSEALGDFIAARGGLDLIFITHRDEIELAVLSEVGREGPGQPPVHLPACAFQQRFSCQIAVQQEDAGPGLGDCEFDLIWKTDCTPESDLQFLHIPGHTPGSAGLILNSPAGGWLFCGDSLALDESGGISTEIDEDEVAGLPPLLDSWSRMLAYEFEALIPLHTYSESPVPFITRGGRDALRQAFGEVSSWWDQIRTSDQE